MDSTLVLELVVSLDFHVFGDYACVGRYLQVDQQNVVYVTLALWSLLLAFLPSQPLVFLLPQLWFLPQRQVPLVQQAFQLQQVPSLMQ